MPNLPAPVSTAHIQVINGSGSSSSVSSANSGKSGGDAAEPSGENFGNVLQGQIKELATSLKHPQAPKSIPEEAAASQLKPGQDAVSTDVVILFAPFLPVVPIAPSQTEVKLTDLGDGKGGVKGFDKDTLKHEVALDLKKFGKDGAAEIAATGKDTQFADLTKMSKFKDADSQFLIADSASNGQAVRVDGYGTLVAQTAASNVSAQMPSSVVEPKVGMPGWGEALGQKLNWMSNQTHQVAELHLNPPNLGPLEVRLTMNNDQATAIFVSNHAAVRDAIESALPRLREMMADNGLTLGNVSVGSQPFSQQQQAFNGNEQQRGSHQGAQAPLSGDFSSVPETGKVMGKSWNNGMVDTFA